MDKNQFKILIENTLCRVGLFTPDAVNLLLGTAAVESDFCHYLKQVKGPALGYFQIEPKTFIDICDNYLKFRYDLKMKIVAVCNVRYLDHNDLEHNIALGIVFARLVYYRSPMTLPDSMTGYARMWKEVYNTRLGKGSTHKFIDKYKKYVVTDS